MRVNRLRATAARRRPSLSADGITARPARRRTPRAPADTPDALLLDGPALESSAAFREGLVTPQSRGSQLAAAIAAGRRPADAGPGRAADLCAAPGGKTAQLAALLPGLAVAGRRRRTRRVAALRANLDRLGADDVEVLERDVLALGATRPSAGTTTSCCSTRPAPASARWLRDPTCAGGGAPATCGGWRSCSATCWRAAAALVAPGGALTYSVCTLTRAETLGWSTASSRAAPATREAAPAGRAGRSTTSGAA